MVKEYAQVENDEFINIFCTLVQDRGETSSRHVDSSNMHTFDQHHPSEHRWTKDHPLEQVIENPSQSVRTRRQLESNGELCMFALTVSRTESKNIKEAMADSAWIESMQEELHHVGTPMATKHLDADLSAKPTEKHLTAVKRIFRYLKDTIHMGLWYPKDTGFELTAFSDSDHAGCLDSRKSTSGEAENVSLSACCAQVLWMRTQLTDYGFHFDKIPMYCDSKAAIAISCNPV
nr:hypothetical protein [Tanacetum cinerariifolium]